MPLQSIPNTIGFVGSPCPWRQLVVVLVVALLVVVLVVVLLVVVLLVVRLVAVLLVALAVARSMFVLVGAVSRRSRRRRRSRRPPCQRNLRRWLRVCSTA